MQKGGWSSYLFQSAGVLCLIAAFCPLSFAQTIVNQQVQLDPPEVSLDAPTDTKNQQIVVPSSSMSPLPQSSSANLEAPAQVAAGSEVNLTPPVDTTAIRQSNVSQFYHAAPTETEQPVAPTAVVTAPGVPAAIAQPESTFDRIKSHIQLNGFSSTGIVRSNSPANYMIPGYGSVKDAWSLTARSLSGLQLTVNLGEHLALIGQVVANADNHHGFDSYQINAQWLYARFKINENSQISAGRFRLPAFLYSETQQVGYSYPWVFLPNEVYRVVPFQNYNGATGVYRVALERYAGITFSVQPYCGFNDSKYDLYTAGGIPTTNGLVAITQGINTNFKETNLAGLIGTVSNQYFSLRATYAHFDLSGYISHFDPLGGQHLTLFRGQSSSFYSVGGKVDYKHFLVIGEVARRTTNAPLVNLTGFYLAGGYQIGQFLPLFTYGRITTNNTGFLLDQSLISFSELPQEQQSFTLSLAYYLNSHIVAKISTSLIQPLNGTNGLFNGNPQRSNVLLYGVGLDAIF